MVSFATLADLLRDDLPHVDNTGLFINHTLWSRTDDRILIYVRGGWNTSSLRAKRINEFFSMYADGSHLTRHETFPGGHPEWGLNNTLIGALDRKQIVYDVDSQKVVRILGDRNIFPNPEGDIALSPDGNRLVNGYGKRLEYINRVENTQAENIYVIYNMQDGSYFTTPGMDRGLYQSGDVRLDPAPCWRRDSKAIAVPALAKDGTRQTFVIEF